MFLSLLAAMNFGLIQAPAPVPPLPAPRQLAWQRREYYAFVHFGPNTFTGREWGEGTEAPDEFNPSHLDCRQWANTFKAAGMSGVIVVAKHHDGFCLWPSRYSQHTVTQSKWKGGKGDVLLELSKACKAEGLAMGVYLSPWDRNHPAYGTPEYNVVFANMLREVLTHYGPIFEVWFDGANGEGPNGKKQVYDWPMFIQTVRECQPNAVIFSDAGPDVRWVGNEQGLASETNWSTLNRSRYHPGTPLYAELGEGDPNGPDWVPAECDVSIRPGWFYRKSEDEHVKTPSDLMKLYEASVGRGGSLLLNVPADTRGLIADPDIRSLLGFKAARDAAYGHDLTSRARATADADRGRGFEPSRITDGRDDTYWAAPDGSVESSVTLDLGKPTSFDRVLLQEPLWLGQRVKAFAVEAEVGGEWKMLAQATTIGHKRIVALPMTTARHLRIRITDSKAPAALTRVALFCTAHAENGG